ncbi:MAG: hypothetical protein U0271_04475 [Polyangiaceae bacterium]
MMRVSSIGKFVTLSLLAVGCSQPASTSSSSTATAKSSASSAAASSSVGATAKPSLGASANAAPDGRSLEDLPEGTYVADNGFRANKDGFAFPNSGGEGSKEPHILTLKATREMFGDEAVCSNKGPQPESTHDGEARGRNAKPNALGKVEGIDLDGDGEPDIYFDTDDLPSPKPSDSEQAPDPMPAPPTDPQSGDCVPTPGALQWMAEVNESADGGICEGMAVSSLLIYEKVLDASSYQSGAKSAWELEKTEPVRELIGKYFAYQFTDPTSAGSDEMRERSTPNDLLDELITRLKSNQPDDAVTIGFFQRGQGGHAVVPYAVEEKGNDIVWVRVYDNNSPGVARYFEFNRKKNTWLYGHGAINPNEAPEKWSGDAETHTIQLTPLKNRRAAPKCPFCQDSGDSRWIFGPSGADVVVEDDAGHKVGSQDGNRVNTLPGARDLTPMSYVPGAPRPGAVLLVPASSKYRINVDSNGKGKPKDKIAVFGQGLSLVLADLSFTDDTVDTLSLSADGRSFQFEPGGDEHPDVRLALDEAASDYLFMVDDLKAKKGAAIDMALDVGAGRLKVANEGGDEAFDLDVVRYLANGKVDVFQNDAMSLTAGSAVGIDFGNWGGDGKNLSVELDEKNDGSWDKILAEPDEK